MPASASSRAVPPVETISTPSCASPRAKSTSPRLSDTDRSARLTCTSPACTTPGASVSASAIAHHHLSPHDLNPARRDQAHGARQQLVLDLVDACLDLPDIAMVRKLEGLLHDDRPRVHAL